MPHSKCNNHGWTFAQITARTSARVLLRPRSHTTAFAGTTASDYELPLGCENPLPLVSQRHRRSATFTWSTEPCTELPNSEAAVLPALVSVIDSEVTSLGPVTARSAWVCAAFRQAILSCSQRIVGHRFPTYETRSSGYQPHTDVHGSAPYLQSLTGKRSLTYSIAPFMVELFAVDFSVRSPRSSAPVLPVARQ